MNWYHEGCPTDGPAVVGRPLYLVEPGLGYFHRPCVNRSGFSDILAACPNRSLVREKSRPVETGRTRHCLSQCRDEASYGNPRGCQPDQPVNPANPASFFEAPGRRHSIGSADSSPSSAASEKNDAAEPHGGLEPGNRARSSTTPPRGSGFVDSPKIPILSQAHRRSSTPA
jgi:hypothetical protein